MAAADVSRVVRTGRRARHDRRSRGSFETITPACGARAIRVVCLIDSDEAKSILAEAMTDPDPDRRIETAVVVGNYSIVARPYVPLLLENLRRDPTPAVRRAILSALVAIEPASDRVTKARLEAMSDPDPETRKAAVLGIGSPEPMRFILLPDPLQVISLLLHAAKNHDAGVRVA